MQSENNREIEKKRGEKKIAASIATTRKVTDLRSGWQAMCILPTHHASSQTIPIQGHTDPDILSSTHSQIYTHKNISIIYILANKYAYRSSNHPAMSDVM